MLSAFTRPQQSQTQVTLAEVPSSPLVFNSGKSTWLPCPICHWLSQWTSAWSRSTQTSGWSTSWCIRGRSSCSSSCLCRRRARSARSIKKGSSMRQRTGLRAQTTTLAALHKSKVSAPTARHKTLFPSRCYWMANKKRRKKQPKSWTSSSIIE